MAETRNLTCEELDLLQPLFWQLQLREPEKTAARVIDTHLGKEYNVWLIRRDGRELLVKQMEKSREQDIFVSFLQGHSFCVPELLNVYEIEGKKYGLMPFFDGKDARGCSSVEAEIIGKKLAEIQSFYFQPGGVTLQADKYFEKSLEPYFEKLCALFPELLSVWEIVRKRFYSAPHTLIHDDLLPINVLLRDGSPLFVDWETAGIYPYFLDLARFGLVRDPAHPEYEFYISRNASDAFFQAYYREMARNCSFEISEEEYAADLLISAICQYVHFIEPSLPRETLQFSKNYQTLKKLIRLLKESL